jgi:hypothetical protein
MAGKIDIRQSVVRSVLDELTTQALHTASTVDKPANTTECDNLLISLNNEITPLFTLRPSQPTADRSFTVGNQVKVNPETSKNTIAAPTAGYSTVLSTATITLPAAGNANITNSQGSALLLPTMTVGYYRKLLICINATTVKLAIGAEASTVAACVLPDAIHNCLVIGYIVVHDVGGAIQPVTFSDIYQFDQATDSALLELNKYFSNLQMTVKSSNAKRVVISGVDVSKLDLTVLGNSIDSSMLNFTGAEIDFSTGSIYAADGTTPLGTNFTCVTPTSSSDWICYSINLISNTTNADGSITPAGLVLTPTATTSLKTTTQKPAMNAGGINLGWVFCKDSGTGVAGAINNIVQADIKQLTTGGSGSGSGIGDPSIFSLSQSNGDNSTWSTGNNAAFLGGGSIAGTFTKQNVTSPLAGRSSYTYVNATAGLNDYWGSAAIAVPLRSQKKTVGINFPYLYDGSDNDIRVFLYDVTSSAIIEPNTYNYIKAQTTSNLFSFYCQLPATCTSIRIGFQTLVANNGKVFKFDDIVITDSPFQIKSLTNDTDPALYTPTTAGFGTITGVNVKWWREGSILRIKGGWHNGTTSATPGKLYFPAGLITSSLTGVGEIAGKAIVNSDLNNQSDYQFVLLPNVSYVVISRRWATNSNDPMSQTANCNAILASNGDISFDLFIPIAGWTATTEHIMTPASAKCQLMTIRQNSNAMSKITAGVLRYNLATATILNTYGEAPISYGQTYNQGFYALDDSTNTRTKIVILQSGIIDIESDAIMSASSSALRWTRYDSSGATLDSVYGNLSYSTSSVNVAGPMKVSSGDYLVLSSDLALLSGAYEVSSHIKFTPSNALTMAAWPTTAPKITTLSSGSGTYTVANSTTRLKIRMVGAGGGGGGVNTVGVSVAGTVGGSTNFGTVYAVGGSGGPSGDSYTRGGSGGTGGAGGTGTQSNMYITRIAGQEGGASCGTAYTAPPHGGSSILGFGAAGRPSASGTGIGISAADNSGGGGSGGAYSNNYAATTGGGGEYVEISITKPAASYSYTVGAGGAAGSSGQNGGVGGSGVIIVEEYYF